MPMVMLPPMVSQKRKNQANRRPPLVKQVRLEQVAPDALQQPAESKDLTYFGLIVSPRLK